ncbi:MAG TPA: hypothetical protein VI565_08875 [Burkholderiales bacterium]|nr:hypothetical protein [Burkholderiales bacterium]
MQPPSALAARGDGGAATEKAERMFLRLGSGAASWFLASHPGPKDEVARGTAPLAPSATDLASIVHIDAQGATSADNVNGAKLRILLYSTTARTMHVDARLYLDGAEVGAGDDDVFLYPEVPELRDGWSQSVIVFPLPTTRGHVSNAHVTIALSMPPGADYAVATDGDSALSLLEA